MDNLIHAVVFDAYGTLCYISERADPYRELLELLGVRTAEAKRRCMTQSLGPIELAQCLAPAHDVDTVSIEEKVRREAASVRLFPDVEETLERLHARGLKVGVVSNLAPPYAAPLQYLLGDKVDHYTWSFEVGAIKPEPASFAALCEGLECRPSQILMVGDSWSADVLGARRFGMPALHLRRDGRRGDTETGITRLDEVLEWLEAGRSA